MLFRCDVCTVSWFVFCYSFFWVFLFELFMFRWELPPTLHSAQWRVHGTTAWMSELTDRPRRPVWCARGQFCWRRRALGSHRRRRACLAVDWRRSQTTVETWSSRQGWLHRPRRSRSRPRTAPATHVQRSRQNLTTYAAKPNRIGSNWRHNYVINSKEHVTNR